jgi:hypothetical protein
VDAFEVTAIADGERLVSDPSQADHCTGSTTCSLEVGKFADFNVISVPTPVFDPAATVVFACSTMNLDAVYVGGEKLVDHAVLTRSDMAKAASEVETRVGRIRALAGK